VSAPVRFGEWTFDAATRELRGRSGEAHLSPKAFELLGALLEARPRVLTKTELHDRLWPRIHVSDSNLARLVKEVRRALGDPSNRPRLVRTVHRVGYAFCGAVVPLEPRATAREALCRLLCGTHEVALTRGENLLGRAHPSLSWIDSATVSRQHARIFVSDEGAFLEDLGSKNGTFLGGRRVAIPTTLTDGDEVRLGSVRMTFRISAVLETTEALARNDPDNG
jgi:DNA-binding winged helix-turn-helix (wHTH) protein